jgi:hypothetical protein
MLAALHWLAEDAREGDVLVFHFSGHGEQAVDPHGVEEDGMNETMCPVDFIHGGMLTDDVVGEIIVKHLPEGVRLTAIMDCCHSGTGLDLPFQYSDGGWVEDTNPYHCLADVQLFSACSDDEQAGDFSTTAGPAGGAMTTAFCSLLRSGSANIPYPQLITRLGEIMANKGFTQRPVLTSAQRFRYDRKFSLVDIVPNTNATTGRIMRKKFAPRPRQEGALMHAHDEKAPTSIVPAKKPDALMQEEQDDMRLLAEVDNLLLESKRRKDFSYHTPSASSSGYIGARF